MSGKRITIPYSVSKIMITESDVVSVLSPDHLVIQTARPTKTERVISVPVDNTAQVIGASLITTQKQATTRLADLRAQVIALQKQIAPAVKLAYVTHPRVPAQKVAKKTVSIPVSVPRIAIQPVIASTTIIVSKKSTGFFASIMSLFRK